MTASTDAFVVEFISEAERAALAPVDFGDVGEFMEGLNAWVAIESPTADRDAVNEVMDRAAADLSGAGLIVTRIPGTGGRGDHLFARSPWGRSGERGILLLGHLDTVHPVGGLVRNPIRVEQGRAYGPGIQDMKSGAYMALTALRRLVEAGEQTPLPVTILLVSDEEVGSATSKDLIEEHARAAKYTLVLEPARAGGKIVTSRKGVGRYEIAVTGRPAHAGNAHAQGRNAILELARQVIALEAMTDYARGITVNVGLIAGGSAENVVPETATASIDLRMPSLEAAEEMDSRILGLTATDPEFIVSVTGGINRVPYRKSDRADIAALFDYSVKLASELGFELRDLPDGEGSGGSDGQFCIPYSTVLDGLGPCGAGLHTNDEYIEIDSVHERGMLLLALLRTLR